MARALTAQTAETDVIRFLVGTQSLRAENQIHLIDFDDENNLINKNVLSHKDGEIWHISASPLDKNTVATVYSQPSQAKAVMAATIWRMPTDFDSSISDDNTANASALERLTNLQAENEEDVKSVLWHPSGESTSVISLTESHINLWDLADSSTEATLSTSIAFEGRGQPRFTSACWNPHHDCSQVATANDTCIRVWDLRSGKQVNMIENAHGQVVRDLDFNPNKQYYLASCGDDCCARFWDLRNPQTPLKVLSNHSHWVWSIKYNHFHDQLVLTSSSDSQVILSNAVSISSEPFGHMDDDDDDPGEDDDEVNDGKDKCSEVTVDGVLATYAEHEDSVYAVQWSAADPWTFASLSYDGRLVINRVPRAIKYKILL